MSDSCSTPKTSGENGSCCSCGSGKLVLLYTCSGGANVGEISDKAARELMFNGEGTMFCLAGLGGDIQGMVQTARDADINLVIDGCPIGCARKTFDRHGITNFKYIRVTDLGIEKVKGQRGTEQEVGQVIDHARTQLNEPTV